MEQLLPDTAVAFIAPQPAMRIPAFLRAIACLYVIGILFHSQPLAAQDLSQISKGKPFSVTGSIGVEGSATGQSGGAPVPAVSSLGLNANLNFNFYGWSMPLSATYYNHGFSYGRPFERYGISPHYKWITLHAGWRSVAWSPLVFSGVTFLGGGIELNPGKLRFGIVGGVFNKGQKIDTAQNSLSSFNAYAQSAYRRTGYAVRLGYGTAKSYIDFVFFHAKDDTGSATRPVADYDRTPQENSAFALAYRQAIRRHLTFTLNGALSLFTRDLQSDTIPTAFYERYTDINRLQPVYYSTQLSYAGDAALAWHGKYIDWKIGARRFSPFYQCLGIYTRLQDYQEERLDVGYHSKSNRFHTNLSLGEHNNNIASIKVATTSIYTAQVAGGYEFSQSFGIDIGYSFNGFDQVKKMAFYADTLLLRNNMHGVTAGAHYMKTGASYNDAISFSTGYQTSMNSGLNLEQNKYNNFYSMLSNSYSITASRVSITTSLSAFGSNGNYGKSFSVGGSAGVSKSLAKNRFTVSAGGGYFHNSYTGSSGSTLTGNGALAFRSSRHHTFSLAGNITHTIAAYSAFSIYRGQASYQYSF